MKLFCQDTDLSAPKVMKQRLQNSLYTLSRRIRQGSTYESGKEKPQLLNNIEGRPH